MRQNIDSLIVQAKNAPEALGGGHEWPVAGQYVRIELQVFGHVAPHLEFRGYGDDVAVLLLLPRNSDDLLLLVSDGPVISSQWIRGGLRLLLRGRRRG